ncbi:MAG: HAD family hydrolase [Gaiellaceae bacterium]
MAGRRLMRLRAVLFDVDFTLARPGPELGPEGYRRLGERFGMQLDPDRYDAARSAAREGLQHHPELLHDEEIWVAFTEAIIRGMGGEPPAAHEAAVEMTAAWLRHGNFDLYEDALPVLEELRRHGLRIGLVSNTGRDLDEFLAHHAIPCDAALASGAHGRVKPHRSIFEAVLARLGATPAESAMVGDSPQDDIEGALALGMQAFLLDRDGRHPEWEGRLPDLYALPRALGLPPAA